MIKAVSVTNFKNETLRMELTKPEESGLIVYNIEGIGGAKANINTSDIANGDGAWYNSSKAQSRNIVLSVKLMPKPTIEDTRHDIIYRYFPIKKNIRLTFETDLRTTYIDGYVESNETPIFSSEEYTQVSVVCPDPYFYLVEETSLKSGASPLFEFEFCDDSIEIVGPSKTRVYEIELYAEDMVGNVTKLDSSDEKYGDQLRVTIFGSSSQDVSKKLQKTILTSIPIIGKASNGGLKQVYAIIDNKRVDATYDTASNLWTVETVITSPDPFDVSINPTLEFSSIWVDHRTNISYDGSIDTGLTIHLELKDETGNIVIYNITDGTVFRILDSKVAEISGNNLKYSDKIEIVTHRGNKHLSLYRDGDVYNITGAVDKDSTWFQLTPGDNIFQFVFDKNEDLVEESFSYNACYTGV